MVRIGKSGLEFDVQFNGNDVRALDLTFQRAIDRVTDWRPVWEALAPTFHEEMKKRFDTQGAHGGKGRWVGLSRNTLKSRARRGFPYPAFPIMVNTGTLRDSLTGETEDTVDERKQYEWAIGTRVKYAIYHQSTAPRRMLPRRAVVVVSPQFRLAIIRHMHSWAIEGKLP
jgi:hypothetical protein